MQMLSKEQLEKIVFPGPVDVGGAQSPIVTEMAIELLESRAESLSLREQLEAERQRADTLQTERDEFRRRLKLERSILEDTEKQLAELKALPPFTWGLADKDGNAYLSECCIGDEGCMIDEAEGYNYELEPEHHIHAVPLFTAAKPAED
jgi:hypothetical protein